METIASTLAGLEKSAVGGAIKGLHGLVTKGLWRTLGSSAKPTHTGLRALGNRVSRAFYNPVKDKGTGLGTAMGTYGLAGFAGEATGKWHLPGSTAVMDVAFPGMGALMSAPGAITTARMASKGNKAGLKEHSMTGARQAAADFVAMSRHDPRIASQKGLYTEYMRELSPDTAALMDLYGGARPARQGLWKNINAARYNPQELINNRTDQHIFDALDGFRGLGKSGMVKEANPLLGILSGAGGRALAGAGKGLKYGAGGGAVLGAGQTMFDSEDDTIGSGFGKILRGTALGAGIGAPAMGLSGAVGGAGNLMGWGAALGGTGMTAHALLKKTPYDADEATRRGYAAAQVALQDKLDNMGWMERLAMRVDPSVAMPYMEAALPGVQDAYENSYGKFSPGFLGRMTGADGGRWAAKNHKYYSYDAAGTPQYLQQQ